MKTFFVNYFVKRLFVIKSCCQMHVIFNQGYLLISCNTVASVITCFPNGNPWPYGIDFDAASPPLLHRAEANIRWIGLKINALSPVWLIHSLSGVITVPGTTMSQARRGGDVLSRRRETNELTPSNGRNMLKCVPLKTAQSCSPVNKKDTWTHSLAVAVGLSIINLSNNKQAPVAWLGLALTLSNYHTALWWSMWVKRSGQASWHRAPFSLQSVVKEKPERASPRRWAVTGDLA